MTPWTPATYDLPRPRAVTPRERTLPACPSDAPGRCTAERCVREDAALLRAALQSWVSSRDEARSA